MEENKKGPGVFYAVVGVATLVVAIIGATFAYFSASAQNTTDINGNTAAAANLTLTVKLVSDVATAKNLVPMHGTDLTKGLTGTDGKSCVDANGNTVCQVYEMKLTNGSKDIGVNVDGTMTLNGTPNMKWEVLQTATTLKTGATAVSNGTAGNVVKNDALTASGDATYYVVIWLEELDQSQDETDAGKNFTATVNFNAVNAEGDAQSGITASFGTGA